VTKIRLVKEIGIRTERVNENHFFMCELYS